MINVIFYNWYGIIGNEFFVYIFGLIYVFGFIYVIIKNWL
jgi:hypothetical protein